MSDYTPTTDEVRDAYVDTGWAADGSLSDPRDPDEFDRWLAAHDAEVRAQALREAADELDLPGSTATGYYASEQDSGYRDAERDAKQWLRARAEQTKEDR